jgi:hypothetical protein
MFASDIQFPLHDQRAVDLFFDVMKWFKPNSVDFVGDLDNADSTSRWSEGSVEGTLSIADGGVTLTKDCLAKTRKIIGKDGQIFLHDGNHGWHRHENYLKKNAPQFLDIVNADLLYGLEKSDVSFHRYDKPPVQRFNNLWVHHGVAISKHAGESVKADMYEFDVPILRGHSHRMGMIAKTSRTSGRELRGYEIGHMCDPDLNDYTNNWNWQKGFAVGYVVDGFIHVTPIEINNDYVAVVGNKVFRG